MPAAADTMQPRRTHHQHSASGLQQLEGVPLRLIAMQLSNPGPLAASCSSAHSSLDADFVAEWFLHWVHVLMPLRPWQFAAVTWQRLGGPTATAEQLCAFILRISTAKQQQQQATPAQQQQQQSAPAQQQQQQEQQQSTPAQHQQQQQDELPDQQQQQQPEGAEEQEPSTAAEPPPRPPFGPMPHNMPVPSVVHSAQGLLATGAALEALTALCPGERWLMYHYAALAGNWPLLRHLNSEQWQDGPYPTHFLLTSDNSLFDAGIAHVCATAALKSGKGAVLAWVVPDALGPQPLPKRVAQLFRYAVRHSTAACIQELDYAANLELEHCVTLAPRPQHLAMVQAGWTPGQVMCWPSCCV